FNKALREVAGLDAPRFDGIVRPDRFGTVDADQTHACAGLEQERIAVDDAFDTMNPWRQITLASSARPGLRFDGRLTFVRLRRRNGRIAFGWRGALRRHDLVQRP